MRIYNCEMDTGCLKKFPCLAKAARHGASLVKLEKRLPKIECGPRASHPRTASFVCSCPGTVYRGGGDMNATASIFPRGALHVLKLGCRLVIVRSQILNRCGANSSALLSRARRGEEAATPGQPVCACARFWKFPSAIRSRESPLLLARRNHLVEPETITFRWNPISSSLSLAATQKRVDIVNKLWTMRLPCGR